ncbi:uncharacterized protein DS421_11g333080 [Arachis hypogaea]|nr:uncharacterized protein DS421_11g333080 [Arachis hypogaea]
MKQSSHCRSAACLESLSRGRTSAPASMVRRRDFSLPSITRGGSSPHKTYGVLSLTHRDSVFVFLLPRHHTPAPVTMPRCHGSCSFIATTLLFVPP